MLICSLMRNTQQHGSPMETVFRLRSNQHTYGKHYFCERVLAPYIGITNAALASAGEGGKGA